MNGNINKVNNCQFTEIYFINCFIETGTEDTEKSLSFLKINNKNKSRSVAALSSSFSKML